MTSKKLLVQASKFFENGAWETDAADGVNEMTEVMGVSTNVGATAFTRTPCGASSTAAALVSPSTACLVVQ